MILATVIKRAPLLREVYEVQSEVIHAMDRKLAADCYKLLVTNYVTGISSAAILQTVLVDAIKKLRSHI